MRQNLVILICAMLTLCAPLHAQEGGQWNVAVSTGAGYMLHGPRQYVGLARSFWYPTADVRIGHYLTDEDPTSFAALFNFPNVGLGVNWKGASRFDWIGKSYLNNLLALYGFFERDFVRTPRFSFGYDFSLGVGLNSSIYDATDNPENLIFNSGLVVYLGPSLHMSFRPSSHWEFGLTGRFTHYSTGRLVMPNQGFNGLDLTASARYALAQPRVPAQKAPAGFFQKRVFYEVYAGYGVHRCSLEWEATDKTKPWLTYTMGAGAYYQYSKTLSSGVGVDVFLYTPEFMDQVAASELKLFPELHPENYNYQPVCFGLSGIQQVHYGNLTAWVQVGVYLYKHLGVVEQSGYTYQRFGGKILFPELGNLYLGIACKCHHFSRAASLDFTLGIRI